MRADWDVGVRQRRGVGNKKVRTKTLVKEARSEPARLGEVSKAISTHEKGQEGEVAIAREDVHL